MKFAVPASQAPQVPVSGSDAVFPVHRIYCVGRNYAEHAREMGDDPDREPPFFFSKPADAVAANGSTIAYPPRTRNLHHEIELVVALGAAGQDVAVTDAESLIFGYAVGVDLTRRDLQAEAKKLGRPWDTAKGFDQSAPLSPITQVANCGLLHRGSIWLRVNGDVRQQADIGDLIWSVAEVIAELSTLFSLQPGDLIFTGTPAGVGPLQPGDVIEGGIEGLENLVITIAQE